MTTEFAGRDAVARDVVARDAVARDVAIRVMLRPVAAPLPVGFLALAGGSFTLAGWQLRWIEPSQQHMVALCLLAFVVALQLLSAVFAMLARDVVAGTGIGVLAGTWFAIGLVMAVGAPGRLSGALGLLLLASAAALSTVAITAVASKPLATVVIGVTAVRFLLAGVWELDGADGWREATGVVGVILAVLAWYAATALALENERQRPVLPLWRRGPVSSQAGIDGLPGVVKEPGVRKPA